ncbi:MAG: exo-alpha-sialidase [Chloroflexi bacterium]|nr:MAG: exo-alpha-sialidase [Chloroflexota bacterium]
MGHTFRRVIASAATASVISAMALVRVSSASSALDPGAGNVPQGLQSNTAYAASFKGRGVTNVFVTSQKVSCYVPEVPSPFNNGPNDGYTGETPCPGANTGEDVGPYASQVLSRPGYPATTPMLVTDHSESDIRVDPTNPNHLIGSSKWFAGAEGYNHLLGFYESWDGGKTWPVMGHVPGYEGFTDNTDPVGAFDAYGNYYQALLPYQFYYDKGGHKKYETGNEPNPGIDNEAVSVAVRPHGSTGVRGWITTHNGKPDNVFTTNAGLGQEPDKEWIAIDRNPTVLGRPNPNFNRVYMMYVNFNGNGSKPYVQSALGNPDGTHGDWTAPVLLPTGNGATNNNTYLYPHVDRDGVVYTPVVNYASQQGSCCVDIYVDYSTDGGATWQGPLVAATGVHTAPLSGAGYVNTTFEDGIEETFAVGDHAIYLAYESKSSGFGNILLTASFDQGRTWSGPIQVNDNASGTVDEFQPNLAVGPDGTLSINFYDRRLACPAARTAEAVNAGLALDRSNPNYAGSLPPYGASNYCVTSSVQFYARDLTPKGHNVRLTQHSWDPQLNSPDRSCPCNQSDTFLGDYFGNDIAGTADYSSFVSTYDDGSNPHHYQQQVVAKISVP